jgi:hypothetical protein
VEAEGVAACKKNATRLGAHIVFVDESGFSVIPNVCRTWAPSGETPIHRHNFRREKVSAISGVSLSPVRHRVGLYYRFHFVNIKRPHGGSSHPSEIILPNGSRPAVGHATPRI